MSKQFPYTTVTPDIAPAAIAPAAIAPAPVGPAFVVRTVVAPTAPTAIALAASPNAAVAPAPVATAVVAPGAITHSTAALKDVALAAVSTAAAPTVAISASRPVARRLESDWGNAGSYGGESGAMTSRRHAFVHEPYERYSQDLIRKECTARDIKLPTRTKKDDRIRCLRRYDDLVGSGESIGQAARLAITEPTRTKHCAFRLLNVLFSDDFIEGFLRTGMVPVVGFGDHYC
jgi:hypothetical protein